MLSAAGLVLAYFLLGMALTWALPNVISDLVDIMEESDRRDGKAFPREVTVQSVKTVFAALYPIILFLYLLGL